MHGHSQISWFQYIWSISATPKPIWVFMLRDCTTLPTCTQKMMLLNCCHFFGLRRPGRAPASSGEWSIPGTTTSSAGCDSHSSLPIQNLAISPCPGTLCNSCPKHLQPLLLSTMSTQTSPTAPQSCAAASPRSTTELLTGRHKLPAVPALKVSPFGYLGSLSFGKRPGWAQDGGTDRKHQGQMTKLGSKTTPLPYCTTSQLLIYKTSVQIISFFFCSGIKRTG